MQGTLVVTGGSFAQYFPYGGAVTINWGATFPLQILWQLHGFATSEFNTGTIDPAAACGALSSPAGGVKHESGLPRVAGIDPNDLIGSFTQTNNQQIPCSAATPCGSMDVALGTGGFDGDLVVTVQLSGAGQPFQFDRMGFNSNVSSGLFLDCFAFGGSCTSGVGGATLGAIQTGGRLRPLPAHAEHRSEWRQWLLAGRDGLPEPVYVRDWRLQWSPAVVGLQLLRRGSRGERSVQRIHCNNGKLNGPVHCLRARLRSCPFLFFAARRDRSRELSVAQGEVHGNLGVHFDGLVVQPVRLIAP